MKISLRNITQLVSLTGLIAVGAIEALRPGTIGAAVNLGLVVLFGGIFLLVKKSPASSSQGNTDDPHVV